MEIIILVIILFLIYVYIAKFYNRNYRLSSPTLVSTDKRDADPDSESGNGGLLNRERVTKEIEAQYDKLYGTENAILCVLVGLNYRFSSNKASACSVKAGDIVRLSLDTENKYNFAVKVFAGETPIGCIPKIYSEEVLNHMESSSGYNAIVISNYHPFNSLYVDNDSIIWLKLYPIR